MALNPRITDWRGRHVWLVGASTGIGRATAALLHRRGALVTVSARSAAPLDAFVAEHPGAQALALDATDADALRAAAQTLLLQHGRIDLAMYCAGHYRAMTALDFDLTDALRHQQINVVGALNLLDAVLAPLLRQAAAGGPAHLSLVASVAGYRGLPNALAYGPTKAALINLAEVLYLDLQPRGVGVSLINPGFVETPLTAQNHFYMPALITPEAAAQAIVDGWEKGAFEIHFPKRFTRLLKAMRQLPDRLYFGLVRRALRA
jgi:NAD(P)-dependent dehydrogenase (short-subunit alcohol dehydrogenase family)